MPSEDPLSQIKLILLQNENNILTYTHSSDFVQVKLPEKGQLPAEVRCICDKYGLEVQPCGKCEKCDGLNVGPCEKVEIYDGKIVHPREITISYNQSDTRK